MGQKKRGLRVLVADDSEVVRARLAASVSEIAGVEWVDAAKDGEHALALFRRSPPEAAVIDFQMPVLDGLGVLRAIRATRHPCLVIVLTAVPEPSFREQCLGAGADHFLSKASDFEHALGILADFAASRAGPSGQACQQSTDTRSENE